MNNPIANPFVRRELKRPLAWARKRRQPRAMILMYHGVGKPEVDPWSLFVTPETFADHMQVVTEIGTPMTLTELGEAHRSGTVPDRAIAVTFDDGYLNNLTQATPILERFAVPATVFAIVNPISEGREFWWDELGALLLRPGQLPSELEIPDGQLPLDVGPGANYTESDFQADHSYREGVGVPSERIGLYTRAWERLMPLRHDVRNDALTQMAAQLGATVEHRDNYVPVTPDQLQEMDRTIVDVGAHTMSHPLLPKLSPKQQQFEIFESKRMLENQLGRPVTTFSYPFGGRNTATIEAARRAGFDFACTTVQETVSAANQSHELPRFDVKNWTGEEFNRRAQKWFRYL